MIDQNREKDSLFESELKKFENEVGVPVVPGELRNWCSALNERLTPLIEAWKARRQSEKARIEEILRTDLELAHRAETLQQQRVELSDRLDRFQADIQRLLTQDTKDPQGSWEPAETLKKLREDLLAWIVHCRAHDKEIDTWMLEAIQRDRGSVD